MKVEKHLTIARKSQTKAKAPNFRTQNDSQGEYLSFERLISDLSAGFVNVPPDQLDREIEGALKEVLEFFRIDRCALLQTSADRKSWKIAFVAYADNIPHLPEKIDLPLSLFPWVASQVLDRHEVVFFKNPDQLPPDADIDKQTYYAWKIKSSMTIPILIGLPVDYVLAINAVSHECVWSEVYIPRLRLLGEIFVNALERRRADRALHESEEQLSLAAGAAGAMLWSLSINSGRLWTTKKAKEFFGFAPDSGLDLESFLNIVHPEDREKLRRTVNETIQSGRDNSIEYRIVRPDGSIRWVLSRGRIYPAAEQRPARLMGVSIDVTEQKEMEESLRKNEERYRTVADYTYDWEYWSAPDGKLIYVSPSCERITGYPPQHFIDNPSLFREIIMPDDLAVWDEHDQDAQAELKTEGVRFRIMRHGGGIRWIEHCCQSVRSGHGEFLGHRASNRDITDRKETEEALKKSEAAFRTSQQDLQRLAGRLISAQEQELRRLSRELHDDLTQKLAVLAIEAGKLEQEMKRTPGSHTSHVQKISRIKDHLITVSEEVHQISRQIHPSILDDLGLVRAIESEREAFLRREKIRVNFVRDDTFSRLPRSIALCLYRIVQESLKNVAGHSLAEGVEISLKGSDDAITLTIKDDGIGFDPQEVRQKRGLGLASMRERVQLVRGDFSVKSGPGQGTVVNVRVPLTGCEE